MLPDLKEMISQIMKDIGQLFFETVPVYQCCLGSRFYNGDGLLVNDNGLFAFFSGSLSLMALLQIFTPVTQDQTMFCQGRNSIAAPHSVKWFQVKGTGFE